MKIGYIQFEPKLLDVEYNLKQVEDLISQFSGDLLVLPEFFNSGYTFKNTDEVASTAEKIPNGKTTDFLIELAKSKNIYISGGLPEIENNRFYNSSVLVGPKGYMGKYRKVHLYYMEKLFFERGNIGYPVFDVEDTKVGMLICFDWFFPEAMRELALNGAQIILHSTNLVLPFYQDASKIRALENRVFIVLSNRTGIEKNGDIEFSFTGRSQIVSPKGKVLTSSDKDSNDVKVIEIEPNDARNKDLNEFNNILFDAKGIEFRKGISGIIVNDNKEILAFQRKDYPDNYQLPQGGIDNDETPEEALKRELLEETNVSNYEILKKTPVPLCYELENNYERENIKYRGQCHIYFLLKLKGDFNFKSNDEFISYKWIRSDELLKLLPPFKKVAVKKALKLLAMEN